MPAPIENFRRKREPRSGAAPEANPNASCRLFGRPNQKEPL